MSTLTVSKRVDPAQLEAELGGSIGVSVSWDGSSSVVTADISEAALQAALSAHAAVDKVGNQRTLEMTLAADRLKLSETKVALDAIAAKTNNQISAADTKVIARELRTIVNVLSRELRLSTRDFSGTD